MDFSGDPLIGSLTDIDPTNNYDWIGLYSPLLKPGNASGFFCIDIGSSGGTDCDATFNYSMYENALLHVIRVLGGGQVTNLPYELQDRRYYFKLFGQAYIKYLKAFRQLRGRTPHDGQPVPRQGTPNSGLAPSDVRNQQIDLESLFFDYSVSPGAGGAQTYDKFEYIDREFIGQGNGGAYNFAPWDFEFGCDLFGGNQRYDNWYRRMDREEIAMYSAMLTDKSDTPGAENNVNITNLFGSVVLAGNAAAGVAGAWPTWACAVGQAGDPAANCGVNAPLDPTLPSNPDACGSGTNANGCNGSQVCAVGFSYEAGTISACGRCVRFHDVPEHGLQERDADLRGLRRPRARRPAVRRVGHGLHGPEDGQERGHAHREAPALGVPRCVAADAVQPRSQPDHPQPCCEVPQHRRGGALHPELRGGLGEPVHDGPVHHQPCRPHGRQGHDVPLHVHPQRGRRLVQRERDRGRQLRRELQPGQDLVLHPAHPVARDLSGERLQHPARRSAQPVDRHRSVRLHGRARELHRRLHAVRRSVEGQLRGRQHLQPRFHLRSGHAELLRERQLAQHRWHRGRGLPRPGLRLPGSLDRDVLHVGMYDSAQAILGWFAAHPGLQNVYPQFPSAESACNVLFIRSPADNYLDYIISKANGVSLKMSGGAGLGRVTDIVLWDPGLVQSL